MGSLLLRFNSMDWWCILSSNRGGFVMKQMFILSRKSYPNTPYLVGISATINSWMSSRPRPISNFRVDFPATLRVSPVTDLMTVSQRLVGWHKFRGITLREAPESSNSGMPLAMSTTKNPSLEALERSSVPISSTAMGTD